MKSKVSERHQPAGRVPANQGAQMNRFTLSRSRWSQQLIQLRALLLIGSMVALSGAAAVAQKDTGGITGIVSDPTGAVVSGAKVTITDVDRGTTVTITTNTQGEYVASPLKIGRYTVTIEKSGFRKAVLGPVKVDVQEQPAVNAKLRVGSVSETVTITTEGPQLETETSELGQIQDSRTIETLPLNGRNYAQLALLGAGVGPAEPGSRVELSYGFSSNGSRSLQNNFQLDGIDNNSDLGDAERERIRDPTFGRCHRRIQGRNQFLQC
jgi:hypothetical protein